MASYKPQRRRRFNLQRPSSEFIPKTNMGDPRYPLGSSETGGTFAPPPLDANRKRRLNKLGDRTYDIRRRRKLSGGSSGTYGRGTY